MNKLNIEVAKISLKERLSTTFTKASEILSRNTDDYTYQIVLLRELRSKIYENLNQLQHENLIIKAAEEFKRRYPEIDEWHWHPNQTSGKLEPDLQGSSKGTIVVSAEITTSQKPIGTINMRMKKVMKKLEECPGDKYYVVETDSMKKNADVKIKNGIVKNVTAIQLD